MAIRVILNVSDRHYRFRLRILASCYFFFIVCAITTFDKTILGTFLSDLPVMISSALVASLSKT